MPRLRAGDRVSSTDKGRALYLLHRVLSGSEVHPASMPVVYGTLSAGLKRPEREADNFPPSTAEVKNAWNHMYLHSPKRFHGVVLYWDSFTFHLE